MKSFMAVILLVATTFAVDTNSEQALRLARILAQKGTITTADLAQIESAANRVDVLANILRDRGVLSASEYARVSNPSENTQAHLMMVSAPATPLPQAAPDKPAAPKGEVLTQSGFSLEVYGTLLLNAVYNTALTNIEDIPLFSGKQGSDLTGADKNFAMTARQSRLGFRLRGGEVAGAKLGGQVEIDFLGGKAAFANGVDMDLPRLRLAYGKLDWKQWSLEAGQDWALFAPLNPTSLAEFAIPEFSASGNAWIRLPQLRAEYHNAMSDRTTFQAQFAALDPNMGDFPIAFTSGRTPLIGERGRGPAGEIRLSLSNKVADRTYAIGLSTHYARGKNFGTFGAANTPVTKGVDSWGVAADYSLPFTKTFNLSGEIFEGRALGIFSAASGQAILPVNTVGQHGVETRGGWIQGQLNLTPKWQANLAYGLESPNLDNLRTGDRSKNQTYMANLMYKLSKNVTFAWEYRRFLTNFKNQFAANEQGDHANIAVACTF
jgi:Gram-negative porin